MVSTIKSNVAGVRLSLWGPAQFSGFLDPLMFTQQLAPISSASCNEMMHFSTAAFAFSELGSMGLLQAPTSEIIMSAFWAASLYDLISFEAVPGFSGQYAALYFNSFKALIHSSGPLNFLKTGPPNRTSYCFGFSEFAQLLFASVPATAVKIIFYFASGP